ncbi:hypothetical protein BD309DRAFT_967462 [Dichomitus squalens]|uniref:Cytochrome c oxidase subunit 8, mitochondrial n=1 Tax=Dichomitus squalens TaxID=114155 RepID=A0A4Q9NH06_9APHY|nr:uncharacterized protein DICSQDRAFT_168669 [Dichomitus squalens LYAD-421 SS1]EJF63005.1 hypothetical protein DICSQDRAFT_168669 [Dichomitus squalens LYAD-421 SS1]TBU32156.1 hypothetical protein BD311DRAFT_751408 [Dichomitus squalens]TBU40470.1 hypothetical protein BD309DRAFT_967462 [Dichomitus squalens]TBU58702.1 hypothetical protein BD310DRAFT_926361 [Dichomitus squalens]
MSLLARSAVPLRQVAVRSRAAPARYMSHGEYKHIPFDYEKKGAFGLKVASYLIGGFSIPFIAAYFQLYKAGKV